MSKSPSEAKSLGELPPKPVVRLLSKLHVFAYRMSGGRLMHSVNGTPICLVTMTRRRSGTRSAIPLMYNPAGEDVLLVASLGGAPKHPLWYYNLMADPHVEIQVGRRKRPMLARQASPQEKAVLWPSIVENFPSFEAYQQKTARDIPVIICSPVAA
jgi:deazaflavin-dependent oxidoreductase (nitroreductase family)